MPFHPIALHFHIAAFMVNIAVIIALAVLRCFTSPNITDEENATRKQKLFQALDWVCSVTIILGLAMTAAGIGTGFYELVIPPHIKTFEYDMYMQIKIFMSFIFLVLYVVPLVCRARYGKKLWKSAGMSVTYIVSIVLGFFLVWVTTSIGSYDTSYQILGGPPGGIAQEFLVLVSGTGIFCLFGAMPGNLVANYAPGEVIEFSMTSLYSTILIAVSIILITYIIFFALRTRQIKKYRETYNVFQSRIEKGKISSTNIDFQEFLKEFLAYKIEPIKPS